MKKLFIAATVLGLLLVPGQVVASDHDDDVFLEETYDDDRDWALGLGLGLVELGDNVVEGGTLVTDDDVEMYYTLSLRIPFGDRQVYGGSSTGFRGYIEPELAYWEGDFNSDLLFGINLIGGMPFNAVEFYVGGGIGIHFLDSEVELPAGVDDSDDALGVNAQFGVDISVSEALSFYGMGRFDLVDDDRDELEGKAGVGLRFHF